MDSLHKWVRCPECDRWADKLEIQERGWCIECQKENK